MYEASSEYLRKGVVKIIEQDRIRSTRQKGSHIRLTCTFPKEHHVTIPNHDPIRIGTLAAILSNIAASRNQTKEELINLIFG